jgi:hypothetical protein
MPLSKPVPQPTPRPPPGWRPFAAVYDGNAPVVLNGKVTGVDWVRPFVKVHMTDETTGKAWVVEGGAPEVMADSGYTREQLAAGAQVTVRGYQAKDKSCAPECMASGRDLKFADGRSRPITVANLTAKSKQAMVEAAQADVDLAQHVYEDAQIRFNVGLITKLELEAFRRDVIAAKANLAVMQAR